MPICCRRKFQKAKPTWRIISISSPFRFHLGKWSLVTAPKRRQKPDETKELKAIERSGTDKAKGPENRVGKTVSQTDGDVIISSGLGKKGKPQQPGKGGKWWCGVSCEK